MPDARPDLTTLRIQRDAVLPRRRWPTVLAFALALLALGAAAWHFLGPGLPMLGGGGGGPRVELARVQRAGGAPPSGTAANGYVVARRRAALSTEIQGRVVEMRVEEGDFVEQGALIARLDTSTLEATLARTQAELRQARAEAEFARKDFERLARLEVPVDITQTRLDQALAARDAAEASVEALAAAVEEIEVRIRNSSVYAPFAGIIVEKNAEVGEVVSSISGSGPNARGAVATLVDRDTLEVQVELAQTSLRAARLDAPVLIYLDAYPADAYKGRVRQIWPTADRTKATVELRVEFTERDRRILPEMGVRVVFVPSDQAEPQAAELLVDARAVVSGAGGEHVFVWRDGRVSRRAVVTERPEGGGTPRVIDGLAPNEMVVLDPPAGLADGDAARPREHD